MGVHVVETERELEVEVAAHEEPEEESEGGNELVEVQQRPISVKSHGRPRAHVSPRYGLGGTAFARGRGGHCQTH
jgi:hypothetical protein